MMTPETSRSLLEPPTPDGKTGWRALKAMLRHKSILAALQVFHDELGDVFRVSLPGFSPIFLVGPEANHFVLVTARNDLRWRSEQDPAVDLLRHGVLVQDGQEHDHLRRVIDPALHRRKLAGYVEAMWASTDQVTAGWTDHAPRDMLVEMRRIALLILMRTLFGIDFRPDLERLWPSILRVIEYISPGLWLLWRGWPRWGYARARRELDEYLYWIIARRRAETAQGDDMLSALVRAPGLSDDLVRDQLLTILIAGHDTSTALLAWTLYLLGSHPEAMERARAEVEAVLGDQLPSVEHASQLVYLDQVTREALRLYPPIHIGNRIAACDLEFQGFRIPAGSRVVYSIYLTHHDQRYWPDPERFDPERFSAEQSRSRPGYVFVPFGGGPRNCLGAAFAQVESKVVLARLLQQFELTLVSTDVHPHMGATLEPRPGVMMRVRRLKGRLDTV